MTDLVKGDASPMRSWLKALNAAVRNPQSEKELFGLRLPMVDLVCRGLGEEIWNVDTLRDAVERFDFWPSVSELYSLLADWAKQQKPIEVRMGGPQSIGRAVERLVAPTRKKRTAQEIEAVEAKCRVIVDELRAQAAERDGAPSGRAARRASPQQLVAQYALTERGRRTIALRPDLAAVWRQMHAKGMIQEGSTTIAGWEKASGAMSEGRCESSCTVFETAS